MNSNFGARYARTSNRNFYLLVAFVYFALAHASHTLADACTVDNRHNRGGVSERCFKELVCESSI